MENLEYFINGDSENINEAMIFIHGYGANGPDLLSLSEYFMQDKSNCVFIAPNAPFETNIYPDSYFWFPLENKEEDYLAEGVHMACQIFEEFLEEIKGKYALTNADITLCGFSQGSLLAMHFALLNEQSFKAVLAYSGGALSNIADFKQNDTPICLIHGEADEVLEATYSKNSYKLLHAAEHPVELHLIPGLGHSINHEAIELGRKFLATHK